MATLRVGKMKNVIWSCLTRLVAKLLDEKENTVQKRKIRSKTYNAS